MAEYRVTALHYRFVSETDLDTFATAAPWSGPVGSFACTLSAGTLTAIPAAEYRDREAAKQALEPRLRAWEQAAFLSPDAARIRFEYERSDVEEIDRPRGSVTMFVDTISVRAALFAPTITRVNSKYPGADPLFARTPLTDSLTARLRGARDAHETWSAFAYYVLTRLEGEYCGETSVATTLAVSRGVLQSLSRISSKRDPEIGRKGGAFPETISPAERAWLEAVVVRLIRRVGEREGGASLPLLTMSDFPTLA